MSFEDDAALVTGKIWELPDSGFFRCHEIARIYVAFLEAMGHNVTLEDGLARYRIGFFMENHFAPIPDKADYPTGEDPHSKFLRFMSEYRRDRRRRYVENKPDELSRENAHSWCRTEDYVIDRPGRVTTSGCVLPLYNPLIIPVDIIGRDVFYDPCGVEERRGSRVYIRVDDYETEIHPAAIRHVERIRSTKPVHP